MIGEDGILKELELAGYQYLGGPVCSKSLYNYISRNCFQQIAKNKNLFFVQLC